MLEIDNQHPADNKLRFSFPEVHADARMAITFQRTFRIPDDGKKYPLPPGIGAFPLRHVDDYKDTVPEKWLRRGGVILPMYQSEALWLNFTPHTAQRRAQAYPFAIKVAAGKVSALTGESWAEGLKPNDYVVIPLQPYLDGFVVDKGVIRQFIAAPLGAGASVEEQLTGAAEHGGIQIEVIPMKAEVYERRFPLQPVRVREEKTGGRFLFNSTLPGVYGKTTTEYGATITECSEKRSQTVEIAASPRGDRRRRSSVGVASAGPAAAAAAPSESDAMGFDHERCDDSDNVEMDSMSLGAGGSMQQQVHQDPFSIDDWDLTHRSRVFVALANSMTWVSITGQDPPHPPMTASRYKEYNYPWFDHYKEGAKVLTGTSKLAGVKTVLQVGKEKGVPLIPENVSVKVTKTIQLADRRPNEVREGEW